MREVPSITEAPEQLLRALADFQKDSIFLLQALFPEEIENSAHLEEYLTQVPEILGKQDRMGHIFDSGLAADIYPEGLALRKFEDSFSQLSRSRYKRFSTSCDLFTEKINTLFQSGHAVSDLQLGYVFYFSRMRMNFLWGTCRENKMRREAVEHETELDEDELEYPGEEFREGLKREFIDKMNSMYFDSNRVCIKKVNLILNLYRYPSNQLGEDELLIERIASEKGGEEQFYTSEVTSRVTDALSQFFDDFFSTQELPRVLGV